MNDTVLTILAQLGGNKFFVMTGAKILATTDYSVLIKLPKMSKVTYFEVIYVPGTDLYEIAFFNMVRQVKRNEVRLTDVYNEDLCKLFESNTGLYTKLF